MTAERNTQYPFDLARLVVSHLEKTIGRSPAESVLVRLFETLYFASLRTDEGRQPLCTVNFVAPDVPEADAPSQTAFNRWTAVPFAVALPLDVRTITKLARAADPEVSSLNVFADAAGDLFIWGNVHNELEQRKEEVLGCLRFVASLSCVDGVVLLDKYLAVHGFGVELRTGSNLDEVFMAGDAEAQPDGLRRVDITHFGTRHRAMMRYCYQSPGSLGFAISQDGGIQAMLRIGEQLVVWENIDVALAFDTESWAVESPLRSPVFRWFGIRAYR